MATESKEAEIRSLLTELYHLKNTFRIEPHVKKTKLEKRTNKIVALTDALESKDGVSPADVAFFKGHALNVGDKFSEDAEAQLMKSVKLDSAKVEAWNSLAESYWKKRDLNQAKSCLDSALAVRREKETLRLMSIVIKNVGADAKEQAANVQAGVDLAREALGQDVKDGESWYVLGNALLAQHFKSGASRAQMESALAAYKQAEACIDPERQQPDLFYNRGKIYQFLEDYQLAVNSYVTAYKLDDSFQEARDESAACTRFVKKIGKSMAGKYGLKGKRLASIVANLDIGEQRMEGRQNVPLLALKPGKNAGLLITGIVVASIVRSQDTPQSFVLAVPGENYQGVDMLMVSIYNVSELFRGDIKKGDVVQVLDPQLKTIQITDSNGPTEAFQCISATDPTLVRHKGLPLTKLQLAFSQLTLNKK